jgi:hypothetical protein
MRSMVRHLGTDPVAVSRLPDVGFEAELDEQGKRVAAKSEAFNSSLLAHPVTENLPTDTGVVTLSHCRHSNQRRSPSQRLLGAGQREYGRERPLTATAAKRASFAECRRRGLTQDE